MTFLIDKGNGVYVIDLHFSKGLIQGNITLFKKITQHKNNSKLIKNWLTDSSQNITVDGDC